MAAYKTDLPLACKTLVEVAELLRARQVTSTQLTKAVLDQIAAQEPMLHAYTTLTAETALEEAAVADAEIEAAGTTRSPLHGIPIAVKDLCALRPTRTPVGCAPRYELWQNRTSDRH